jgi:capsular exopolysaccharide synthesis family protein
MKKENRYQNLLALYNRESSVGTEFRRLYSNIKVKSQKEKLQNIMITSAMVGEGKSLTSSLLALTIAELTKLKIALVDFDLRRPKISTYFGIDDEIGVADVLDGKKSLKDISCKTSIPNLTIIPAGKFEGVPSDLLDQEHISNFFQELRFYFDHVIVDSPPVIPISDPLLIAEHVDGVILVIRGGVTQREVVGRAANLLVNSQIKVIGAVLNDFDQVLPYYYKDHYYGYKYYRNDSKAD